MAQDEKATDDTVRAAIRFHAANHSGWAIAWAILQLAKSVEYLADRTYQGHRDSGVS